MDSENGDNFQPGIITDIGFMWMRMFRRVLLPGASYSAALVCTKCNLHSKDCNNKCQPSELPIYPNCNCYNNLNKRANSETIKEQYEPGALEETIGKIRRQISNTFSSLTHTFTDNYGKIEHDLKVYKDFLQAEENSVPRYGTIGIGALTGYIYGSFRGRVRKYLYTILGGLTFAAMCYPKEASQYSQLVYNDSKKYAQIGYNFVAGVKPGDEVPELPELPKIPTTLSEFGALADNLTNSIKELIFNEKTTENSKQAK